MITREQVIRELGLLEDLTIALILELGPTIDELVEARGWLEEDASDAFDRDFGHPSGDRVLRIVRLVSDERDRQEEEEPEARGPAPGAEL